MKKIQRVSLIFSFIFQGLMILAPFFILFGWIMMPTSLRLLGGIINLHMLPDEYTIIGQYGVNLISLNSTEKYYGFLITLLPLATIMGSLFMLAKLFRLYAKGIIFTSKNVTFIRYIGYFLLLRQLINPIYEVLLGFALPIRNASGMRFAAITIDQTNLAMIAMALIVLLISWIMAEACRLQEEQQLTV